MRKVPLFKVFNSPEVETAAIEVMRSGRIAGGHYVQQFETELAEMLGQQNVVSMSDMTSAIYSVLHMSGVTKGDDVITTSFSCMATNAPISAMGANAVWVDVTKDSVFVDPVVFEQAITPQTKAAILYHVSGYPGAVVEIAEICKRHGIVLLEDCNNAFLAKVGGEYDGGFGDYGIFSFYPTRLLQTFEGAAVVCRNEKDAESLKRLRRLGIDFSTFRNAVGEINVESDIPEAGWASSFSNLNAAVGCAQLLSVQERMIRVRDNVRVLRSLLSGYLNLRWVEPYVGTDPSYWTLLLLCKDRDRVLIFLKKHGIHVSALHQMNDGYSCFQFSSKYSIPNSVALQKEILAIPCGWWLSQEDLEYIATMIGQAHDV